MNKIITITLICIVTSAIISTADIIRVPEDFPTIQQAIDESQDGDIVILADDEYTGEGNRNLDFDGKAITVRSSNGPENCIINCEGLGRGFYFANDETSDSVVQGLTITNGHMGGVNSGGGIFCHGASPTIIGNIIENCYATSTNSGGCAIHCRSGSDATIEYNTLRNNQSFEGAGVNCGSSSPIIRYNIIEGNSVTYYGGGIRCDHASPIIEYNKITSNSSDRFGGGIYCSYSSYPVISNNILSENTAMNGGGIYCLSCSPNIKDSAIINNSALYESGGGIFYSSCDAPIRNCVIAGNFALERGGGIRLNSSDDSVVINCLIVDNMAERGGGLYLNSSDALVRNCTFSNNSASQYGGGIYSYYYSEPTIENSIVYLNSPDEIDFSSGLVTVNYSNVYGGYAGTGNIDTDPLFVTGPQDDFYLSHLAAGQGQDSACIDAGSDLAANLELDTFWTRTDGVADSGQVDMGYHCGGYSDLLFAEVLFNDGGEPYEVSSVATDGTQVEVIVEGLPSQVTDNDIDYSLSPAIGQLGLVGLDPMPDGKQKAVFSYTAPTEYGTERSLRKHVAISIECPNVIIVNRNLTLHRPPLFLIHGIWSKSHKAWVKSDAESYLLNNGFEFVEMLDYVSTISLDVLSIKPWYYIHDVVEQYKLSGMALSSYDIVAHSMGGLIARGYLQSPFSTFNEYRDGVVCRKLVTIGTPHSGSELANYLVDGGNYLVRWLLEATRRPVNGNQALRDLRVNSDFIDGTLNAPDQLANNSTHCHAIHADAGGALGCLGLQSMISLAQRYSSFRLTDYLGESNDLVVREVSQRGRMDSAAATGFMECHTGETGNSEIQGRLFTLLNTPISDAVVWRQGFEPEDLPFPPAARGTRVYPLRDDAIEITSPTHQQHFSAGDTVQVTTDVYLPTEKVFFIGGEETGEDFTAPFEFSFQIPQDWIGTMPVLALAIDDEDAPLGVDTLEILVNIPGSTTLQRAWFSPNDQLRISVSQTGVPLTVLGLYDDGVTRDISSSVSGTVFTSTDPAIVTVDAEGMVTPMAMGQCQVVAQNSSVQAIRDVVVGEDASLTFDVSLACTPATCTLPNSVGMDVAIANEAFSTRRISARINVTLANGSFFPGWRAGWTNIAAGQQFETSWNQGIPLLGALVGENEFMMVGTDVTTAPYNQPPYMPSGSTSTAICTVTCAAP